MQFFLLLLLAALLPVSASAQDDESWNAHFQSTYIRQIQPAFHSPCEASRSLRGEPGASYSLTITASLGVRLGHDTEVHADPEAVQGVPLSGLGGLAAFPNGELAKTSGPNLTLHRARLFVRHTFELGGDAVAIDSGANQLKSTYQARRLVVTAGNVSVLDLFDGSSDAHDPRTRFMNWALMTYGAYDYLADARGYTNGLPLDNDLLRHYGDQLELVHTHMPGTYAGALRVLAFRSRARMSTCEDALGEEPVGDAPSLAAVRSRDHVKAGIGIDAEQQVACDLGMFVRAMKADGKTETYAFTESDASFTAGLSLKGARWSRDMDVVGLALGADAISTAHREYLERGGLTSFLGAGFTLTTDVQRVANPGYNKDRGPAPFYALRLHWEV